MPINTGEDDSVSASIYNIKINGKSISSAIESNEYMAFDMKTAEITISIVRGAIESKSVTLNLKASKTYYLKIEDNLENNSFNFIEVDENQGLREISKTGLSGSVAIEENSIVTEIVEKEENSKFSKIDEIKKAHILKEQGILTLEEFEKLKKEILTK